MRRERDKSGTKVGQKWDSDVSCYDDIQAPWHQPKMHTQKCIARKLLQSFVCMFEYHGYLQLELACFIFAFDVQSVLYSQYNEEMQSIALNGMQLSSDTESFQLTNVLFFKCMELTHYVDTMFVCLSVCFINKTIPYISITIFGSTLKIILRI
jgi:hypothetical protein